MTAIRHFRVLVVLLIPLRALAASTDVQEPLDARSWIEVTSPNFRIYSVLDAERTVDLLRHLEIMRATLGDASEESTWRASVPTIIVAVDDHGDYVSIGAPGYSGGYFFSDLRENAILVEDSDDSAGIQIILHEYAHYLNRQLHHLRFPRWFEEGNAEYLSHSRLVDQAFEYGLAPESYLSTLAFGHWMPLSALLEVSDASSLSEIDGGMFYAQSWLLVHFLRSQPGADGALADQVARYVRNTSQGEPLVAAFEEAFDIDSERLDTDLLKYFLERDFTHRSLPANTALPGFTTRVREMSAEEAQLALAQMALLFDNVEGAERWFRDALTSNDLRALAEAGLGRVAGYRGNIEAANARFESAIRLMAWDFTIWMDYAQYWAQRVAGSYNAEDRVRYASRLIDALESALTISEATPELNSLMGFAYLAKGNNPHDAIEYLEAASDEAPHDQASRLLLANAYLYVGRFDDAIRVAENVLLFEHKPGLISGAAHDVIDAARERRRD